MINCVGCGKETNNPKFCCRSCGISYNNRISPKRIRETKICEFCKKEFSCRNISKQKYCNQQCLNNHKDQIIELEGFPKSWNGNRRIRRYLIKKFGNNCMICGQSGDDWNGKPITLIVDHIDGKSDNNQLNNLRLVCPNCDCQLPTFKGRNKGNSSRAYFIVQKPK